MFGEENVVLSLLGTLAVLAVVLVLAYLTTRFLAVHMPSGLRGGSRHRHLTVVEQVPVGKESKLLLVKFEDRYLLLGITQGGVTCLKELPEEEVAAWIDKDGQGEAPVPPSFREQLQRVLERKKP